MHIVHDEDIQCRSQALLMLSDSQQIETSSHITLLFVSNLCLHVSIFITGKRQNPFACEKAFSGKHVCGKSQEALVFVSLWQKKPERTRPCPHTSLYLEKPNDPKKDTAELKHSFIPVLPNTSNLESIPVGQVTVLVIIWNAVFQLLRLYLLFLKQIQTVLFFVLVWL